MTKKLKIVHILISFGLLGILSILCFIIYTLNQDINKLEDQINTLTQSDSQIDNFNSEENTCLCTKTVTQLKDIHPINGCNESDISLNDISLDGKDVDIQAIFSLIDSNDFYSLDLYINSQKVESELFSPKENPDSLPSYIWNMDTLKFVTISEDENPTFIGIYSMVAGQAYDKFLLIVNNQGKSLLEIEFFEWNGTNLEEYDINNTFKIETKEEIEPNTGTLTTRTYIVKNGTLQLEKTENITYEDYYQ